MPANNGLLKISEQEWTDARTYFAQDFSRNPHLDPTKMSKKKGSKTGHSFIKVGDEIFAIANRKCYGEAKHGLLGEGAFGKVKIVQTHSGENFAVKVEGRGLRGEHDAETKIMQAIGFSKGEAVRHLKAQKAFKGRFTTQKLYTVMKLREGKELEEYIYMPKSDTKRPDQLSNDQKLLAALFSCKAVQELHDKGIIHADLKPANLMAKIDGTQIVVSSIDFGFSMQLRPEQNEIVTASKGSPMYMAPELDRTCRNYGTFSFASDIYALGVMFKEDLGLDSALYDGMLKYNRLERDDMNKVMLNVIAKLKQSPTLDSQNLVLIAQLEKGIYERENQKKEAITAKFENHLTQCKDPNKFIEAISNAPSHLTDSQGYPVKGQEVAQIMRDIISKPELVTQFSQDPYAASRMLAQMGITSKYGIRNGFVEMLKVQNLKNTIISAPDEASLINILNAAPDSIFGNKARLEANIKAILAQPSIIEAMATNPRMAHLYTHNSGIFDDYGLKTAVLNIVNVKYQAQLLEAKKQEDQKREAQADLAQKINQAASLGIDEIIKVIREHPAPLYSKLGQELRKEDQINAIMNLRDPKPGAIVPKITSNYDLEGLVNRLVEQQKEAKLRPLPNPIPEAVIDRLPPLPQTPNQVPLTPPSPSPVAGMQSPPTPPQENMELILRTVIAQNLHGKGAISFEGKNWDQVSANVDFAGLKTRYMVSLGSSTSRERLFLDRESPHEKMVALREKIANESRGKTVPEILAIVNKHIDALTTDHPSVRGQSRNQIEAGLDGRLDRYLNDRAAGRIPGKPANRDVSMDELVDAGILVCRHKGLLAASIMGQLIDNKILPPGAARQYRSEIQNVAGRTIGAHTWSVYRDGTTGDLWVNDPRWAQVKKVNPARMSDIGYGVPAVRQMMQRLDAIDKPILDRVRVALEQALPKPHFVQPPNQPVLAQVNQPSPDEQKLIDAIKNAKSTGELIEILKATNIEIKSRNGMAIDKQRMLDNLKIFSSEPVYINAIANDRTFGGISPFAGSEISSTYDIRNKFIALVKEEHANKLKQQAPLVENREPVPQNVHIQPIKQEVEQNKEFNIKNKEFNIENILNKANNKAPQEPEISAPSDPVKEAIAKIEETQMWAIGPRDKRQEWLVPLLEDLEKLDKQNISAPEKRRILEEKVMQVYNSAGLSEFGHNAKRVARDILVEVLKIEPPVIVKNDVKVDVKNDPKIERIINLNENQLKESYNKIRDGKGATNWARVKAKNLGQAFTDKGQTRVNQISEMAKVFEHLKKNPSPENSFKVWSYLAVMSDDIQKENNKMQSALLQMCNKMMSEIDPQKKFMDKRIDQIESACKECKAAVNTEYNIPKVNDPGKNRRP